jgi:phosphoribosylformimino-5-aminoimidazole carboxamide ribotide isomerase
MIILPAIDLKNGMCVRLRRGDFSTAEKVAESAADTAAAFRNAGARWVHMVDLDGARSGVRVNSAVVKSVAAASGLMVELGGGLRTMEDLEAVSRLGVSRMVIGSAAVDRPEFVREAVLRYGEHIAVGVDALDGKVRTAGWERDSGLDALAFARRMEELGVRCLIFTDIATDGMLSGPSFGSLAALSKAVRCNVVASGGVTTLDDVKKLRDMGLYGAIIGKAYYAGTIDLHEAAAEAERV